MSSQYRSKHSKLYIYYSTMGYIFQIIRDLDPKFRMLIDTFTLLGLLYSGRFIYRFITASLVGFRTHVWSRVLPLDLSRKYGQWAVVTGATDGIGLEYATQLATKGLSIIIIGRNSTKLDSAREKIQTANPKIEVVTVQADLNRDDPAMYQQIAREISPQTRDIGILINNAGVMFQSPNRFLDQSEAEIWQHVRVNMLAVVMMTRVVLPSMVAKKRGLIVNMSSIAAYQPLPLMGLYSASKVFVEWFSQSLEIEYRQYNIDVQTVIPNYIATKMTSFSRTLQRPSLTFPDAATFTSNAIATIGRSNHTTGYWFHELTHFFTKQFVPDWAYRTVSWYFLKYIDDSKRN